MRTGKKYIKEKNYLSYDEELNIRNDNNILDKIIYKEIITNLDSIGLTQKEEMSFKLYYIDNFSIKEIAKKIDTSENNIKYYLYNARKKVKERWL